MFPVNTGNLPFMVQLGLYATLISLLIILSFLLHGIGKQCHFDLSAKRIIVSQSLQCVPNTSLNWWAVVLSCTALIRPAKNRAPLTFKHILAIFYFTEFSVDIHRMNILGAIRWSKPTCLIFFLFLCPSSTLTVLTNMPYFPGSVL